MVRLLRRILRLGLLAGVGVGILKLVRGRKAPDPWADSWVSTGPAGGTRPSTAPVAAAAPKPPAPAATATASLATPPAASPQPPAPADAANAAVATPPPASPQPPAPAAAGKTDTGKTDTGKSDSGKADSGKSDSGKSAPGRASKPTRKGPARRSPTGRAEEPPGERLWVQANDGMCPQSHPVKAKMSSKIFHIPGGRNYKSTKADRCYPDEASAQADGLRPALR
ncbi:MAG TPA: hypothetical protein VG795_12850 [Acidimicrobiia bacterium]|nr:hypothetical protein [Acidimicrobiia bacterium]